MWTVLSLYRALKQQQETSEGVASPKRDLPAFPEGDVTLQGWVRTVRASKHFAFLELADGSTVKSIQVVLDEALPNFTEITKLNVGAAVEVSGSLVLTPEARQPFEMKATCVRVEGSSPPEYPLQKKRHSLEFLRGITHLRPRTNTFQSAFRVRSEAAFAIHDFFHSRGFLYVHTPIITASDAEGAGEMFRVTTLPAENPPRLPDAGQVSGQEAGAPEGTVDFSQDFFGCKTHLTVSGQLEAEAYALAFGKTYTFGPTFRAENSNTPRHAAEFWMIEPEMAFADLEDDMRLAEDMVKHVLAYVLEACPHEMEFFNTHVDTGLEARLTHILTSEFGRLPYTEAIKILEQSKETFTYPVYWGCDLKTEHERYLTETVMHKPVFVTDYPQEIKAFYMRQNDDGRTVAAMDLLVPGVGELIGGSQREERYDRLRARLEAMGLPVESYAWYLDLRRFGGTRHAGFGLGFERLILYLTGLANIRDVIPFPRTAGSAGI